MPTEKRKDIFLVMAGGLVYHGLTEEVANKKAAELVASGLSEALIGKFVNRVIPAPAKVVPL